MVKFLKKVMESLHTGRSCLDYVPNSDHWVMDSESLKERFFRAVFVKKGWLELSRSAQPL